MGKGLAQEARRLFGKDIAHNEPLSRHCSFGIGGPARLYLSARHGATLKEALVFSHGKSLPLVVLGKGTNVLIPDSGFPGLVICVQTKGVRFDGTAVVAQAGASLSKVAKMAMEKGLAGMEFCAGIPGSVGGAAIMNAGAHGEWIGELIKEVSGYDALGEEVHFRKADLHFGYRESILQEFSGIVCEVILRLREDDPRAVNEKMQRLLSIRRSTQPARARCAGSIFKNPEGDSAGRLIELAGCKGMRRNGAVVSRKHANFITNRGGATYSDVKGLIEAVKEKVRKVHGVELELEIVDLGEDP